MANFLFIANSQSLDFVNTEVMLDGSRAIFCGALRNFGELTQWFAEAGVASAEEMSMLRKKWEGTAEAAAALQAARKLQRVLRSTVKRVVSSGRIAGDLTAALNKILRQPRLATDVVSSEGRLTTKSRWLLEKPGDLLVPLAHEAANFFATADYSAIRKCENPECILFFYDTSKNHTRRWCSMEMCGNRAKVSAFRNRT